MQEPSDTSLNLDPKVGAGLAYLGGWITGLIFMLIEKKNRYIRFHGAQSLVIFGGGGVIASVLSGFAAFPIVGIPFLILAMLLSLVLLVLWIVCVVQAFQGKEFRIPLAADLADKLLGTTEQAGTAEKTGAPLPPEDGGTAAAAGPDSGKKSGTNVLLIVGVVVGAILILCGGGIAALFFVVGMAAEKAEAVAKGEEELRLPAGEGREIRIPSKEDRRLWEGAGVLEADVEALKKFFAEELGDWKRQGQTEHQKFQAESEERRVIFLRAEYRKEDRKIEVTCGGGPPFQAMLGLYGMYEADTKTELVRSIELKGFRGVEHVDRRRSNATIAIRVGRVILSLEQEKAEDTEEIRELLDEMDLEGLSALE